MGGRGYAARAASIPRRWLVVKGACQFLALMSKWVLTRSNGDHILTGVSGREMLTVNGSGSWRGRCDGLMLDGDVDVVSVSCFPCVCL